MPSGSMSTTLLNLLIFSAVAASSSNVFGVASHAAEDNTVYRLQRTYKNGLPNIFRAKTDDRNDGEEGFRALLPEKQMQLNSPQSLREASKMGLLEESGSHKKQLLTSGSIDHLYVSDAANLFRALASQSPRDIGASQTIPKSARAAVVPSTPPSVSPSPKRRFGNLPFLVGQLPFFPKGTNSFSTKSGSSSTPSASQQPIRSPITPRSKESDPHLSLPGVSPSSSLELSPPSTRTNLTESPSSMMKPNSTTPSPPTTIPGSLTAETVGPQKTSNASYSPRSSLSASPIAKRTVRPQRLNTSLASTLSPSISASPIAKRTARPQQLNNSLASALSPSISASPLVSTLSPSISASPIAKRTVRPQELNTSLASSLSPSVSASPIAKRTVRPPPLKTSLNSSPSPSISVSPMAATPKSSPSVTTAATPSSSNTIRAQTTEALLVSNQFGKQPEQKRGNSGGKYRNEQKKNLTIGNSIIIPIGSQGSVLKRSGDETIENSYSEEVIIVGKDFPSRSSRSLITIHNKSVKSVPSAIHITACVKRPSSKNSAPVARFFLHLFRRPKLSEQDLIASSGLFYMNSSCLEGTSLSIPIIYATRMYAVLSGKKSFGRATIKVSATLSTNEISVLPSARNRDILNIYEKGTKWIKRTNDGNSEVFVISSSPNLLHVELLDANVDHKGIDYMYGSTSRFPNSICDNRGTQLAATLVGKNIGVGPDSTTIIPVPIRDCETNFSRGSVVKALEFVKRTVTKSKPKNAFILFDEEFQTKNLVHDPFLLKELESLSRMNVIIIVPGATCHVKRSSYLAVGSFGRRTRSETKSSVDLPGTEYTISSEKCLKEFDTFGPGDFATTASFRGPESYERPSFAPTIAASGITGVLLLMSTSLNRTLIMKDIKTFLEQMEKTIPLISNAASNQSRRHASALPLFGSGTTLTYLRASLEASEPKSNGIFETLFSNLPTWGIISICAAMAAVAFSAIAGGIFAVRSRRARGRDGESDDDDDDDQGDSTGIIEREDIENAIPKRSTSEKAVPGSKRPTLSTTAPTTAVCLVPLEHDRHGGEKDDKDKEEQMKRMPLMNRFFSMTRNKESPSAKGDKASWFATPRALDDPQNITFKR